MKVFRLEKSKVDPCLYFRIDGDKTTIDDSMIFTYNAKLKNALKSFLLNRFKMKDLGQAAFCMQLRITRDRKDGKLLVGQDPVSIPAEARIKLDKSMPPTTPDEALESKEVNNRRQLAVLLILRMQRGWILVLRSIKSANSMQIRDAAIGILSSA
ncbi:uncharacterized protein LOC134206113 [Armigeres subalbatus]|uniref:uncharacterized protein LOC134206113 n=1 Tax=Armigeres subalbatus TaxID=124917 RepID=UPI002ED072C8